MTGPVERAIRADQGNDSTAQLLRDAHPTFTESEVDGLGLISLAKRTWRPQDVEAGQESIPALRHPFALRLGGIRRSTLGFLVDL